MKPLTMSQVRQKFIEFFVGKEHKHLPSSPLIPYNDPTVLLTTAGMLQFKPIMFGTEQPTYSRATTHQKCFRTTDLDNVGFTPRHHTFFEMLGNFSFGDYYKEEAISWAWEFITEWLELPKDKVYVSVFEKDDEAYKIWNEKIGIPPEQIARLGEKDNFWAAGETGPCGPCSELYFDLGESMGDKPFKEDVLSDGNRYLEFYNLVFMEFNRQADGSLIPLPAKNIDTGMGLERITSILQGKTTNYETDLLQTIIDKVKAMANIENEADKQVQTALQVIADHSRASVLLIGDGVTPGNEGRGYVLRRIMRRAIRFGHIIGINEPFLHKLVSTIRELYPVYEEIAEKEELIKETVEVEENRFSKTLARGMKKLNEAIDDLSQKQLKTISGEVAFELYDTYGFPLELTKEIAEEHSLSVDHEGYEVEMTRQVERARAAARSQVGIGEGVVGFPPTEFTGYGELISEVSVLAVLDAHDGDTRRLILDKTPFYAESGGQVSDHGSIQAGAHRFPLVDVQKVGEIFVHVVQGDDWSQLKAGDKVKCLVESEIRKEIMKHHSATHIMHTALKEVLGDHVKQAGSEVTHNQTRFDFTFNRALATSEIQKIEELVNEQIMANLSVDTQVMNLEEAKNSGAIAMFGEKYGESVRVVSMGEFSKEFCGGTHVPATGVIGSFKILSEEAVAAGTRRVTAVVGKRSFQNMVQNEEILKQLAMDMKVPLQNVADRYFKIQESMKEQDREIKQLKQKLAAYQTQSLASQFESVQDIQMLTAQVDVPDNGELKRIAESLAKQKENSLIVLTAVLKEKINLVVAVNPELKQLNAGKIVKEIAPIIGARGGGKPTFAQAGGGTEVDKIPELFKQAKTLIAEAVIA